MTTRSFQLRMALLASVLAGTVLLLCGIVFLALLRHAGLKRMDQDIRALGERQVQQRLERFSGERFEQSLRFVYGSNFADRIVLRLVNFRGDTMYQSENWPSDIPDRSLPPIPPSARRPPDHDVPPPLRDEPGPPALREPVFVTLRAAGTAWRFGLVGHDFASAFVGMDLAPLEAEVAQFRNRILAATPLALGLLALAGWILARRALRPVQRITAAAERIGERDMSARVPVVPSDREFDHLVDVINRMLERIERGFHQATRFSADAAHELKTPLTVLQGQIEEAIHEAAEDSSEQRRLAGLLEEVQRLKTITRKLLLLARADAGRLPLARERVDMSAAVADACDDARTLAPHLTVEADIAPGVTVSADPDLLAQVLQNLLSNATKFNRSGGRMAVALSADADQVRLSVTNTGPGIGPEERARIFERFYRGDPARGRSAEGSGLGLSLSREIARAHGGEIELLDTSPDRTTFRLILPRS